MKFTPLLDRVLILQDPAPAFNAHGLAIPDAHRQKPNTGKVVSAGPGQYVNGSFCPTGPKLVEGARVMFSPAAATTVDHNGAEHLLVREADVFSVLQ